MSELSPAFCDVLQQMPKAELRPIPSIWGHMAPFGANPPDNEFIDAALKELLQAN